MSEPQPLCKVGDRTDVSIFDSRTRESRAVVGEILAVHTIPPRYGLPTAYNYTVRADGRDYYLYEQDISTPYGPNDD